MMSRQIWSACLGDADVTVRQSSFPHPGVPHTRCSIVCMQDQKIVNAVLLRKDIENTACRSKPRNLVWPRRIRYAKEVERFSTPVISAYTGKPRIPGYFMSPVFMRIHHRYSREPGDTENASHWQVLPTAPIRR